MSPWKRGVRDGVPNDSATPPSASPGTGAGRLAADGGAGPERLEDGRTRAGPTSRGPERRGDGSTPGVSGARLAAGPAEWRPGPLYAPIRAFCVAVKLALTRATVLGLEHLPRSGGALLVSNHLSIADPVVLMAVSPRPLIFMAKQELYRLALPRLILRLWGGSFPVRRGGTDVQGVRHAVALLEGGAPLVVFPEGTRRTEGLGEAHRGIGYLAARTSRPVVPVGIVGTEDINTVWDLARLPSFAVRFGEPFVASGGTEQDVTDRIMRRVAALLPAQRRGVYADRELPRGD